QLFDAAVAARTGLLGDLKRVELEDVRRLASRPEIRQRIRELNPGHMPFLFPEVFLRDRPGFDCLIGNPPWEELMADRLGFWTLRFPGLKGMKAADREQEIQRLEEQRPDLLAEFEDLQAQAEAMRRVILNGPYPGIGTGDIDLYKAFAWRFLHLSREGGRVGVVLPRSAVAAAGTAAWREAVLDQGTFEDVCLLTNTNGWVFPEIHQQYTVALTTFAKGFDSPVAFCGPFHSLDEYLAGRDQRGQAPRQEFAEWSDSLSFPRVPDAKAGVILRAMKRHPRFDSTEGFDFRPVAELHATNDRKLFDTDLTNEKLTMPVLTGASFEIWNPDFGEPYGLADPEEMTAHLLNKARRGTTHGSSAFKGLIIDGPHDHPSSQIGRAHV